MDIDKQRSPVSISAPHQEAHTREWKSLNEGMLTTEGVRPCTSVALYDPALRVGYLGHFSIELYQNDEGFHDMIETAKVNNQNASLQAWVGGAALLKIIGTGVNRTNRSIYNGLA